MDSNESSDDTDNTDSSDDSEVTRVIQAEPWKVPLVSMAWGSQNLRIKNSLQGSVLRYNAGTKCVGLTTRSARYHLLNVQEKPIVALAKISKRSGQVRLIRCPSKSDADAMVYKFNLANARTT